MVIKWVENYWLVQNQLLSIEPFEVGSVGCVGRIIRTQFETTTWDQIETMSKKTRSKIYRSMCQNALNRLGLTFCDTVTLVPLGRFAGF